MKKNIVFLLILIPIIWISCDGMGHQTIDFRKVENLMPQHPDSALMLLEQIENKENLSRKDKAHYSLLLTEAEDKTYVTHTTDSLISIAADYYEKTDDLGRKAKAWYYKGRINQDLGHPLKAQEYYLKALRDEEKIEDHALLGRIHNHIGMLYAYQKVYEKALPFQKKAVENFHLINDSTGQAYLLDAGPSRQLHYLQPKSDRFNEEENYSFGLYGISRSLYRQTTHGGSTWIIADIFTKRSKTTSQISRISSAWGTL